ncbi:hypothetical protein [Flavilitoribacter nigricans]|uniref:Uncharacterized protein n=1 Tax=Flavilitoribacter nigricans (strain ATCC 23147 / DSM 23189 / NBRC 102662 / NCIMB 1420 / SS-2) TaxID=1122177 RepID=A0A2D0N227_FLAN2|nr:hypothetical protein [Flavilitoribacter nigricans]PHN02581.1 hypothetical protein CRP01_31900 [Flavilitoribacter nigricans DSM 23189 = NBRC 102662]
MTEELKKYESTIRKKHSFNWTPKFEEEFRTDLSKSVFVPIAIKTFEKLGWDLVFQDEISAEAKRKGDWDRWTEKISVTYEYGKVKVKSVSLGNEMWDNGRNSKRVRLFKYAFQQTEKEFDKEALAELEKEFERTKNWDDYEIPESLPQPKERKEPKLWIPILGGLLTALLLGYVVAFLSVKGIYIIGLFEVGVAFAIGFTLKFLIKASNYTNYEILNYTLIGMVVLVYVSNQYFQYQIILSENNYEPIGFFEFIKIRLEAGLTIKSLNTGWIGMVISWIFQLGFTYAIGMLRLASNLTAYQLERVPMEVVDFAFYHFVKGKTENQVRSELSKMGWTEEQDQNEVFRSIGALQGATELNRME